MDTQRNNYYRYDGELPTGESWSGTVVGAVDFQLNSDLVPDSITVNDSDAISYDYDNDLLLKTAGDLVITRGHDVGLITSTKLGSFTTSQDYNDFGEFEVIAAASVSCSDSYEHDKLGRIETNTQPDPRRKLRGDHLRVRRGWAFSACQRDSF